MEPLTLEELKQMNGKPVWGKSLINDKPGEWFIVRVVEMSKSWFIACSGSSQVFGDKDNYGKTWVAYPTEPHKGITNADCIRRMTDEELYIFFLNIYNDGISYANEWITTYSKYSFKWTLNWLQQPKKD